jgi:hypothetical protein
MLLCSLTHLYAALRRAFPNPLVRMSAHRSIPIQNHFIGVRSAGAMTDFQSHSHMREKSFRGSSAVERNGTT